MLSLELKSQLNGAKEALLYLQKQIEGELARKLMGRESLIEEFSKHIRESRSTLNDVYEKLGQNDKWREGFDERVTRGLDENSRQLKDMVTKRDLSSYNEQQSEAVELKLQYYKNEIQDLQQKVGECSQLKGKLEELQSLAAGTGRKANTEFLSALSEANGKIAELKQRADDTQGKLILRLEEVERAKDDTEGAIGDIHKKVQGIKEEFEQRLTPTEETVEQLKKRCDALESKNAELAQSLERATRTVDNLVAEKTAAPAEAKDADASAELVEDLKVSLLKRIEELREDGENKDARLKGLELMLEGRKSDAAHVGEEKLAENNKKFAEFEARIVKAEERLEALEVRGSQGKDLGEEIRELRAEMLALKQAVAENKNEKKGSVLEKSCTAFSPEGGSSCRPSPPVGPIHGP